MRPNEIINFIGAMDLDSPLDVFRKGFHRHARNVWFRGIPGNKRAESVPGCTEIINPLLPVTGINKTIGKKYDAVKNRIYFLNYNSSGAHAIYLYDTISQTFQRVVEVGVNTNGDPLNFDAEAIYNIDVIYGDDAQGDILYFIDSLGRPTKINIKRALSGEYGTIIRSYIDVAKEPANTPPFVAYENDSSTTVNNLRKKLFKFKIRWVFDDNDKSVTSSQSEIPIPANPFEAIVDSDPTKNCRIAIVYQTGPPNVKKIEILAANSLGNVFSDFFLIASLDKQSASIPNNDISTYLFYNDKSYNNIDVIESNQLFDCVPPWAKTQTVIAGNILSYGNIKEGYPNLTNFSNGSNTSNITSGNVSYYYGSYFSKLIASQSAQFAYGSGVVHIVVRGYIFYLSTSLDTYYIKFSDGTNISYTVMVGDDASAVIEGLRLNALSKGFTIISAGNNDLYVLKAGMSLAYTEISSNYGYNSLLTGAFNAYDWWSKYGWGLVYFDEKGRTNGAVYTEGFSVNSIPYMESGGYTQISKFNASIYHRPPLWAYYYQWVRTKDLTKLKMIQWISDRTDKDKGTSLGQDAYAYISIENLFTFINKNSGTPLNYSYTANNRIRFIKLISGGGATVQIYSQKDFEIISLDIDPTINGIKYTGRFIKILLPSTDSTFDFGGNSFATYFIELYTPAQSASNDLNIYYEYGEKYMIGNPGTSIAIHQGQIQNQSTDLFYPATFEFIKGDYYIKTRSIQTGQQITYEVASGFGPDSDAGRITLGLTYTNVSYTNPDIEVHNSPFNNLSGFNLATDNTRYILKIINGTYTFRMKGTIIITFRDNFGGSFPAAYPYEFFLQKNDGTKYQLVPTFNAQTAGTYTFQVDTTFTMTTGERIFIFGWAGNDNDNTRSFTTTNLTVIRDGSFVQNCIDPNFSDYYASSVNSNGRAFIYDPNANQVTYPTLYRWGLAYQEDTNINKTSRFYPENFDNVDRTYGMIQRMISNDRILIFFQYRKCGYTGIYSKVIQDNSGTNQLATTNDIITRNNVQYYDGNFGVGNQPDSVVQSQFVYYFFDPVLKKILRLSKDGITDLTEEYKVQTWAAYDLPNYLSPGAYAYGGKQRVTGTFNVRPDNTGELLLMAQGSGSFAGEIIAFDESENAFYGFRDINCDCIVCAENVLYYFWNGKLWINNTSAPYANYFGVQKSQSITVLFNDQRAIKKIYNSISYKSNKIWAATLKGDVLTSRINNQTGMQQQSLIMKEDFDDLEIPNMYAAFNRDMNSLSDGNVALWEGDYLTGNWLLVKLSYNESLFSYLYDPYIIWQVDQRIF